MDVNDYEYGEDYVSVSNVECRSETEKALRCYQDGEGYWIPKSQISPESEVKARGDRGTLVITKWLARQEGWSDDD